MVFVHELGGRGDDWHQQVTALSPGNATLTFDNRGHGASRTTTDDATYTVPDMVGDLSALLEHLRIDRCHLVGHSIGGAVAQELAHARPASIVSLTLVGTTDWFGDHDQPGGEPPYIPEALRARAAQRAEAMGEEVRRKAWSGLIAWRGSRAWAHRLACRTLILLGQRDAPRIVEGSQRLAAAINDATLVCLEDVGHSPHLESADVFTRTLMDFLRACEPASDHRGTGQN